MKNPVDPLLIYAAWVNAVAVATVAFVFVRTVATLAAVAAVSKVGASNDRRPDRYRKT